MKKRTFYSYRSISSCYINLQRYEEAEEYALRCLDASVTQSALIQSKLLLFQVTCSKMDLKKADELQKELAQYRAQGVMKGAILENYFTLNGYYYAALGNLDKALAYSDSISDKGLSLAVRYKAFEMAGDFYSALPNYTKIPSATFVVSDCVDADSAFTLSVCNTFRNCHCDCEVA